MAQMPAMAPGPNMATKINAQTTVLIEREATRMKRPMVQVRPLYVVLRAEMKATGMAMTTVTAVPRVAMWMVSNSGSRM